MSHKNQTPHHSYNPILMHVDAALALFHRVRAGEPADEKDFADALSALELFVHVGRTVLPHAKPAVVSRAVETFLVQATADQLERGNTLPLAG